MRFLANENITATVIQGLRQRGDAVLSVKESMRSEQDDVILARAQLEQRIVLTHDKDFGELAFKSGLTASCGVILFRLRGSDRDKDNQRILEALGSRSDWTGHFCGYHRRQDQNATIAHDSEAKYWQTEKAQEMTDVLLYWRDYPKNTDSQTRRGRALRLPGAGPPFQLCDHGH